MLWLSCKNDSPATATGPGRTAGERSVDVPQPTDRTAPDQPLDGLIDDAFDSTSAPPTQERCVELNRQLRAAIGNLYVATQQAQADVEEYSRDWWRYRNALLDTDYVLEDELNTGLAAAIHVAALARQAQALRNALEGPR